MLNARSHCPTVVMGVARGCVMDICGCWLGGKTDPDPLGSTQVNVLVGPDGGLDFGVHCSPQNQEGSHGRLTLRGHKLRRSRHLLPGAGQHCLEISALGIEC